MPGVVFPREITRTGECDQPGMKQTSKQKKKFATGNDKFVSVWVNLCARIFEWESGGRRKRCFVTDEVAIFMRSVS